MSEVVLTPSWLNKKSFARPEHVRQVMLQEICWERVWCVTWNRYSSWGAWCITSILQDFYAHTTSRLTHINIHYWCVGININIYWDSLCFKRMTIMMTHYLSCAKPQVAAVSCRHEESVVKTTCDINTDIGPPPWSDITLFLVPRSGKVILKANFAQSGVWGRFDNLKSCHQVCFGG